MGLVGRNGAGKTTVFRLLLGQMAEAAHRYAASLQTVPEEYFERHDDGEIVVAANLTIGLLVQQHRFAAEDTILDAAVRVFAHLRQIEAEMRNLERQMEVLDGESLRQAMQLYGDLQQRYELEGGFTAAARAESVLYGLGFSKSDLGVPVSCLSGGQRSRLALAMLLLAEPDLLLLDEPTNHLDIKAVEWLEDFLATYKSAYIVISHDRFLLDRVTERTLELEQGKITSYAGNYSFYVKEKQLRQKAQIAAYEKQKALIERTEEFIRRNIAGQKAKQAKSRRNMLERLERIGAVRVEDTAKFDLQQQVGHVANIVLTVEQLSVGYGSKKLFSRLNLQVRCGEGLAIVGGNGVGKTTLLKTLVNLLEPLEGSVRWAKNVRIGYYDQLMADLDLNERLIDELRKLDPYAEEQKLRSFLARFNFCGEEVYKKIADLSGGERSRFALARIVYSKANVLVLDEPTNHLDVYSRKALEEALGNFPGTILVVSHDRYFLDRIASSIVYLNGSSAEVFSGNYSEYLDYRRRLIETTTEHAETKPARKPPAKVASKPKLARRLDEIEQDIYCVESSIAQVSSLLASVETAKDPELLIKLTREYACLNDRLEELYKEWEASL